MCHGVMEYALVVEHALVMEYALVLVRYVVFTLPVTLCSHYLKHAVAVT